MNKKILSLFLAALLLCGPAVPAVASESETEQEDVLYIQTMEQLLAFGEQCLLDSYSENLMVVLEEDVDLTGVEFESIPIFCGTFDGNGHTISGLTLNGEGSVQGLFRYLTKDAVVENLTVKAEINPGGSRSEVGTVAGSNEGLIRNCDVYAEVSGDSRVGGVVGVNQVSGIVQECQVFGTVQGTHFVGGMAGQNSGVLRNCVNRANVNITARQNTVSLSEITVDSMMNSEYAATTTDIGGIAGISSGVIRNCTNQGNVGYKHMGYNVGGIAGTQSGYIVDCENKGEIQGRKEVGGIVGQMEPVAMLEYEKDTLQVLQGQLLAMNRTMNQTTSEVQNTEKTLSNQTSLLQSHMQNAQNSLELLIPEYKDGEAVVPDPDTIQAAQNSLSSSLTGMQNTMKKINKTVSSSFDTLSENLNSLQKQIDAMASTVGNATDRLGGSITDISDQDKDTDLAGKVEQCANSGSVLADMNAGGIAGAMTMENDLDATSDWEISGDSSLYFESEVRSVILNCENRGEVMVKKMAGGGVVGLQPLGLVKGSRNSGTVHGDGAEYVGGISGQSAGYIRDCAAKCYLTGRRYVGGIAGSATVATNNMGVTVITGAAENTGAILGDARQGSGEEENPFAENYYLVIEEEMGGIDGVSYEGRAQAMTWEEFYGMEELPSLFRQSIITFCFEDGTQKHLLVETGDNLPETRIPDIPEKEGFTSFWEGLEPKELENILFDKTFKAVYISHNTVIQSLENGENGLALFLAEGDFFPDAVASVTETSDAPVLEAGAVLLEGWEISLSGFRKITAGRLQLSDVLGESKIQLYVCDAGGTWSWREYTVDGSYLVFDMDEGISKIALVQPKKEYWYWYVAGCAVLAAGIVVVCKIVAGKRKRRRKANEENKTEV